jgi:hypothetical protein
VTFVYHPFQFIVVLNMLDIANALPNISHGMNNSKINQFHIVGQLFSDTGTADLEIWYSVHRGASLSL